MTRRWAAAISVAAALSVACLGLSGCDSDGSNLPATPTTPPPTTPTTTPVPDCGNRVASFAPTGPLPAPNQMPAGSFMEKIQHRGRLIAGVSADTLLFGFRDPLTGNLEGFDIDVAREVAAAIFGTADGHIEYRVLTFAQRIPALTDKKNPIDIVADVMTMNCARWAQISFSSEYFHAGKKVLVRSNSRARGIGDLDGKRVCAAKGSTSLDELKKHPKITAVSVDDISDCMVLFQQGSVDSVTGDDTVLAGFVAQDPYAKIVGDPFTEEPYGLGIAKEHRDFVEFVNGVLERVRADGTWRQWYQKHLGGRVPQPPAATYGRT
jgi:polar amino acid transport system substrate-binding protein